MYLLNCGTINTDQNHTEEVIQLLIENKVIDSEEHIDLWEPDDHTSSIELNPDHVIGNIEDGLQKISKICAERGIILNAVIKFSGDYEGAYVIKNSEFSVYDRDDYTVKAALESSNLISPGLKEKVLDEVNKGLQYLPLNPTGCRQVLETVKQLLNSAREA